MRESSMEPVYAWHVALLASVIQSIDTSLIKRKMIKSLPS